MTLQFTYFPSLDRFAVSKNGHSVENRWFMQCDGYTSLEYLRYVPLDGITLCDINEHLLKCPQELCCEITNTCNAHCHVCIADAPNRSPIHLSSGILANVIEHLVNPILRITITGGEPTAHPDLTGIVASCAGTEVGIVLSTNGCEPRAVKRVLDSDRKVLLSVSLHGPKDVHDIFVGCLGSYDRAIETIRVASERSLAIHVLSMATRETLPTLPELSQALSELPISEHRINLVKPSGRNLAGMVTYEEVLESILNVCVSHKISIKRRDQPFLFLNCLGHLEVRHERAY
ncbi:MAG: radical SAM protein [Syntrophales bacterium]|nr:radical SAM protein [Syntrophales bacterium]